MLDHHKVMRDGSVVHESFSKAAWERAMRDDDVVSHWGHDPSDCHDPSARHWANLRKLGRSCKPKQHEMADLDDPTWEGRREIELVETPKTSPPPTRPILTDPVRWPPEVVLTPLFLSQMSGMCLEDCKEILAPPRKVVPVAEPKAISDKKGQLLLFWT